MEWSFLLKKFISFFLEPLGIVLTLLALGIYFLYINRAKRAKFFLLCSFFFLLLFSYGPFANFLVTPLESQYEKYDANKTDFQNDITYIHVLGNGHTTDKTQPISSQLSDAGVKRVLEGVLIQKNIQNSKIIFTGYKGNTETPNAIMNARLAEALGVDTKNIIINAAPVDTKEEAIFAKSVVGVKPFVLVTSATHMPRAMHLFEAMGMKPIPAPTDFKKEEFTSYFIAPRTHYFDISTRATHEYLGALWSRVKP